MAQQKDIIVKDLHELYELMGLPVVGDSSGFTVNYLQDIFKQLPFRSVPYRPNYFSFLFIREGLGNYTIDDLQYTIQPGTVYFTNPGNFRMFEWQSITDACLITFHASYLKEYVHTDIYREFSFLLTETVEPRVLGHEPFEVLEQLYRQIHREHLGGSPYKNGLIGTLMVVLLLKIKEYFFQDYNPIVEGTRSSRIVKEFRLNLENHIRELLTGKVQQQMRVQDFADRQQLHPTYLSQVIRSKTGKSISTWMADKLVTEARVLLQDQELSVKEIANRLGFLEAPHFSNYFKKHTSLSPADYRKQLLH
ncbi:AraC family transcriptional regulator [Telluribacter sp. SYSU D00476]|uniref:helix-turn-helix domain-containing protein n=1 Tax=Telluribacter sp. SYSU D00476 TaxID=2811430 RepID=UPI001FF5AC69|nr:AraC family transcriptional regulator [Telluribacter sp. SYSU D00476]